MSTKKKKYNCRFPPARIKKIMQADEEVGRVAAVVPLIISRALELFVESLLTESSKITKSRNARTLTPSHLKACITSNSQFSFLREFVATLPDIQSVGDDEHSDGNSSTCNNNYAHHSIQGSTLGHHPVSSTSSITSSSSSLPSSAAPTAVISFSGSNLTRQVSTNRSSRSTNYLSRTSGRGRGRPRKVNITSSKSQDEDEEGDYDEENDITETSRNVKSINRSSRNEEDDSETSEEDDEGSSCDDSSSNASRVQPPNPPLHSQINSFALALNQQVEDDDYDN